MRCSDPRPPLRHSLLPGWGETTLLSPKSSGLDRPPRLPFPRCLIPPRLRFVPRRPSSRLPLPTPTSLSLLLPASGLKPAAHWRLPCGVPVHHRQRQHKLVLCAGGFRPAHHRPLASCCPREKHSCFLIEPIINPVERDRSLL
ncbi:hypothetical protein NDU88_007687 [Pleurodeles waltl]|uniref:Uncharacterized protein n=1 Tax=Pleurodeles waltl TaxID=8319 RepID=A0AAV7N4Z2_PLEWA|nr:hypothetical protein NDU88_007687 [Pleurodeles waltl]